MLASHNVMHQGYISRSHDVICNVRQHVMMFSSAGSCCSHSNANAATVAQANMQSRHMQCHRRYVLFTCCSLETVCQSE